MGMKKWHTNAAAMAQDSRFHLRRHLVSRDSILFIMHINVFLAEINQRTFYMFVTMLIYNVTITFSYLFIVIHLNFS